MDAIKELFGDNALTYAQFTEALEKADKKTINLANLAKGGYVSKDKFTNKENELATASQTIKDLQDAAKKWDGVDVDKLKNDMAALQTKYNDDIAAARLDNALNMALVDAKAKNPKLARAALDMSVIKLDGEKITGLSEQLENLKKSDAYLFDIEDNNKGGARMNTGGNHGENKNTENFMASVMKYAGLNEKE